MNIKAPPFYDISHYKEVNDFLAISPRPLLMGTKATEGVSFVDGKFARFFGGMKSAGIRRLAYHFHRKASPAYEQAAHFVNVVKPYLTKNDIIALDVEEGGETASQLKAWFSYVMIEYPDNLYFLYSRKNILDLIPSFMRALFPALDGRFAIHPLNAIEMTIAEREFFTTKTKTWTAGYPYNPDLYDSPPASYIPDQTRWGEVWAWQYSEDGVVTGIQGSVDLNWMSPSLIAWLGGEMPPVEGDVVTQPFDGVNQVHGERYGQKVYVNVIDPSKVNVQVQNHYALPSSICKSNNADIAWNGDDWDRTTFVVKDNPEPSLVVLNDGTLKIGNWSSIGNKKYHTSGLRYLVKNGSNVIPVDGTDPKYTEVHARSITGLTSDGRLVHLTVDGDYVYAGLTLYQCAQVMLEFGSVTAFDQGGGGDSVEVLKGNVVNVPDDEIGGMHYERKVPQTILIFAKQGGTTMHWTAETKQQENACDVPKGTTMKKIQSGTFLEFDAISTDYNGNWARVYGGEFAGLWVLRTYLLNWEEKSVASTPSSSPSSSASPSPSSSPSQPPTADNETVVGVLFNDDGTVTVTVDTVDMYGEATITLLPK